MAAFIHVVTTPTSDTRGTTFMLMSGHKQYLMGSMPEGLSRTMTGRVARMNVDQCFITGKTQWSNTGGIMGILMNTADAVESGKLSHTAGVQEKIARLKGKTDERDQRKMASLEAQLQTGAAQPLIMFAASGLAYSIATARRFIFRKGLPLKVVEIGDEDDGDSSTKGTEPNFTDENIKVWAMPAFPANAAKESSRSSSEPMSSRKRSFEEFDDNDAGAQQLLASAQLSGTTQYSVSDDLSSKAHRRLIVQGMVEEMFNSGWQLDTLNETKLGDVILPATIFIRDSITQKVKKYHGPIDSRDPAYNPNLTVLIRKPWPGSTLPRLPPADPTDAALSYIVRHVERRGKFLPEKARALKVPKGPKYAQLANGNTVENEDGLLITPDQVLEEPKKSGGFAILDIPDVSYIDSLLARPEWTTESIMDGVQLMLWSGDLDALEDKRVTNIMAKFAHVQHIVFNEAYTGNYVSFEDPAREATRLGAIDSARYGPPTHNPIPQRQYCNLGAKVMTGTRDLVIQTEPKLEIKNTVTKSEPGQYGSGKLLTTNSIKDTMHPSILQAAKDDLGKLEKHRIELEAWKNAVPSSDAEIITLGTGSAIPAKVRNVSSTLVRVPGWGSMLLDCGEGTLGQLQRALSPEEYQQVMQELRIIAITHLHADHHLGTISVIKAWHEQTQSKRSISSTSAQPTTDGVSTTASPGLAVIASAQMHMFLHEYADLEDFGYADLRPIIIRPQNLPKLECRMTLYNPEGLGSPTEPNLTTFESVSPQDLGLQDVKAVHVDHCQGAMAFAFTWLNKFKVSYSGDCRPCPEFVAIGQDSTVCIHEATFSDTLHGEAVAKKHSTIGEAITVADAMNAKALILTHFSQRYASGTSAFTRILRRLAARQYPARSVPGIELPAGLEPLSEDWGADRVFRPSRFNQQNIATERNRAAAKSTSRSLRNRQLTYNHKTDMQVCAALDLMRIKVGEIPQINYFVQTIVHHYVCDQIASLTTANEASKEVLRKDNRFKQSKADIAAKAIAMRTSGIRQLETWLHDRQSDSILSDSEDVSSEVEDELERIE